MRMLKSLAVAAMLMAVAAVATPHASEVAAASQQAAAVSRKAVASIGHKLNDFESVPRHMRKLRKAAHGLHRAFSAKQASSPAATCDQAGFADATARVLQACPSLSGLVSGATSLEEFLPGFCGSECYVALSEELVRHAACVDETTAFLLEFVYTCQTRPQCFSEGFIVGGARLEARCGAQIEALFDVTNVTDAARADAALACSGSCAADQSALVRTYGACLGSEMDGPAVSAALDYMCSRPSGAASTDPVCGVQLKSFGELQCDEASVCAASSKCGTGCQPALTTANLDAACSGCLVGFLPHLAAFGEDPAEMALGLELYCQKLTPGAAASESNPYCFPVAMASLTMLGSSDSTSAATACAATGAAACTDRVLGLAADGAAMSADASFRACLNRTYSVSSCLPSYEASLRAAAATRATGRLACAQNAANGWCWDSAIAWMAASFGCSGCNCQADLSALLTQTGCCAPKVNDFLQVSLDYPATYLPAGQQSMRARGSGTFTYTHTARYSRTMLTRADLAFHGAVSCIGNSTEQWAIVESPCPSTLASPPAAEFPVTLAWERVSANPALKAELEQSLQADTARNLGVRSSQIINGSLQQGTGQVQLRTSGSASASASSGRRQTASTGANCAYRFQVDAATEADATAAVQALQAKQNNGTFVTPSTSRTATSKCTECMDARQDSLVNAAAPAPGAAPPAGGSPSPAGGVAAALAGAVAAALAVMAL